jgi:hypothetical protein
MLVAEAKYAEIASEPTLRKPDALYTPNRQMAWICWSSVRVQFVIREKSADFQKFQDPDGRHK